MAPVTQDRPVAYLALVAVFAVVSVALVLVTGNVFIGFVPAVLIILVAMASRARLDTLMVVLFFAAIVVDNIGERPGMGLFDSPLTQAGRFMYDTFEKTLGLPGGKLMGVEAILLVFAGVGWLRVKNRTTATTSRDPLITAAFIALLMWLFLEVWGAARGGDTRLSLLQIRPFITLCAFALIMVHVFSTRTATSLVLAILGAALIRSLVGIFYWATIFHSGVIGPYQGAGSGNYVMTHSDSILMCTALLVAIYTMITRPRLRVLALFVPYTLIVFFFVVVNNRRIAFVGLALGCIALYFVVDRVVRRRIHLLGIAAVPVALLYVAAAWNSNASWASPVQSLRTVSEGSDGSSQSRVIENYNLVATYRQNPVLGSGFGHEYVEAVHMPDISHVFEAYRFVPHNSVLGLMGIGGILFSTPIWLFFAVFAFTIARTLLRCERPGERLLCVAALGCMTCYLAQCFGDMGLQSLLGSVLMGALCAHVSVLARVRGTFDLEETAA